jgi:4-carboxymuconolactone decarboxylase
MLETNGELIETLKNRFNDSNLRQNRMALHDTGMNTRRRVLGDAHVDRAEAEKSEFDEPFQRLITEMAWGRVWSRGKISLRERSMITIALLAALGHGDEIATHARSTAATGASLEDIREALLLVAIYAGVPAANRAFKIVKEAVSLADTGRIGK